MKGISSHKIKVPGFECPICRWVNDAYREQMERYRFDQIRCNRCGLTAPEDTVLTILRIIEDD